jgi:DNA-binding CsgD family transcriptional regulator
VFLSGCGCCCRGYLSSKEIAAQLFVSPRTIDTHRLNIGGKLNLHGSLALMRFALTHREELGRGFGTSQPKSSQD